MILRFLFAPLFVQSNVTARQEWATTVDDRIMTICGYSDLGLRFFFLGGDYVFKMTPKAYIAIEISFFCPHL